MNPGIGLLLALLVLIAWTFLRRRRAARRPNRARKRGLNLDGSGRFHAVSIRFGQGACEASRDLHGKRFLAEGAPSLPLPLCDASHCRCRFVHHRDRRAGSDRRSPFQRGFGGSATRIEADRRTHGDRRRDAENNGGSAG